MDVRAGAGFKIDVNDADAIGDEEMFVVGRERNAVRIQEFAIRFYTFKRLCCWIEAINLVGKAVRQENFSGLQNDKIVEAVLCRVVAPRARGERISQREAPEKIPRRIVVDEFRLAEVVFGVSPDGIVARVEPNSEHWQKMVAACGNEVRSVAFRNDLHDFLLRETAQVEDFAIGIPGEPFRNEIFFFGYEHKSRVRFDGKFAVHFFHELGEFVRRVQSGKFAFSGGVKPFAESNAILEQLCRFESFAKMLMKSSEIVENGAAIGKSGLKFFEDRNLRASFRRIRGLRRRAAHFVGLRLLGGNGDTERGHGNKNREKPKRIMGGGGHVVLRRARSQIGKSKGTPPASRERS